MNRLLLALSLLSLCFAHVYYKETFESLNNWVPSKHQNGKWAHVKLNPEVESDKGIKTDKNTAFYAYSSKFEPFSNEGKSLVLSYQVKNTQERLGCGGTYIKLLGDIEQSTFNGDTPYFVMFGPDVCGSSKKLHFIISKDIPGMVEKNVNWLHHESYKLRPPQDKKSHVYTLVLNPDNSFEVFIDKQSKHKGKIPEDFEILPSKTIPDPSHIKPDDWVDEEFIDDPNSTAPDNHPAEFIPDPAASKPEEWNDEDDGEWIAPSIPNPDYVPWNPTRIKNPKFKGKWVEKMIDNPDYERVKDLESSLYKFDGIASVGFDLWQVDSGSIFDNIIVADNLEEVWEFVDETWGKIKDIEESKHQKEESKRKAEEEERRKKWEEERKQEEEQKEPVYEEPEHGDDFEHDFDEL
ncbi:hypothetical protein RCL1_001326 [Eukaryota sp. TZLM3-RCL]